MLILNILSFLNSNVLNFNQVLLLVLGQLGLEEAQAAGMDHNGPLTPEELKDVVIYTVDIAATLWYFVDITPPAAPVLINAEIHNK